MFDLWAMPHQRPPASPWHTWVVLGGRGAGKTRAGAEWVRSLVEGPDEHLPGTHRCIALVGETIDQVREVMVRGDSGILACSPPDRKPLWVSGRNALVWPNGAEAMAFSATNPESLRGPQFDAAWADELAKWPKDRETWDMLQFGVRLGSDPKIMVTTTPRRRRLLVDLLDADTTVVTSAPTSANAANLAPAFLRKVMDDYGGTRLGRQELNGEMLTEVDGALWSLDVLEAAQIRNVADLDRIVVAVDPPAGGKKSSDACGIVVAGIKTEGDPAGTIGYVLADCSVQGLSPDGWARAVLAAAERFEADRVVAEVNQGGDMVREILMSRAPGLSYRAVHATRGKIVRAEPVAALYEQGKVRHVAGLDELESQMAEMTTTGFLGSGSPDRVDALVWALTELMLGQRSGPPQVRVL
ncbi:MAG: terminase family protein [Pseudomonadota bacterium]